MLLQELYHFHQSFGNKSILQVQILASFFSNIKCALHELCINQHSWTRIEMNTIITVNIRSMSEGYVFAVSVLPSVHRGGGVKNWKMLRMWWVMGSPKNALIFSPYAPFGQVGGGGGVLNVEQPYLQKQSFYLLQIIICYSTHIGKPYHLYLRSYGNISENYLNGCNSQDIGRFTVQVVLDVPYILWKYESNEIWDRACRSF